MNLNEGRKAIGESFRAPLARLGFQERKRLTFARGGDERLEIVAFSARMTRDGKFCFSVGVGVRFAELEKLPRSPQDQELFYTVGKPLHLLRDDHRFTESCIDTEVDANTVSEVIVELERYGLPFLDKCRTVEDVAAALQSDRPGDWFTLSRSERDAMLKAIESMQESS